MMQPSKTSVNPAAFSADSLRHTANYGALRASFDAIVHYAVKAGALAWKTRRTY